MIFISYAKEDQKYAHTLFARLKEAELSPWMDKPPKPYHREGLRSGDRWRSVLERKIRAASQIILVLSPTSVRKRGFVRREFRLALDLMNELPDDQLLVIPVVAEECDVPSLQVGTIDLADIQWEEVPLDEISDFVDDLASRIAGEA